MKTRQCIGWMILAAGLLLFTGSAFAQDEILFVDDSGFAEKTRPAVYFPHDEHNENAEIQDCNYCHHTYNDNGKSEDETSEDMECSECHLSGGKTTDDLTKIYHVACKGCHEEVGDGPVMCADCHNKKREEIVRAQP